MKINLIMGKILFLGVLLSLAGACKKDKPTATATILSVSDVTVTKFDATGLVTLDAKIAYTANSQIGESGFCFSRTNTNPEFGASDSKNFTIAPDADGKLNISTTELNPNDSYYVRAYAQAVDEAIVYGQSVQFKTPKGLVTDKEGNTYRTITIGNQVWMDGNWRSIKFNDGAFITRVDVADQWKAAAFPARCEYNNNDTETNISAYGLLYNWYAISHAKFAPEGWRVPTKEDFDQLATYLGGANVAGGKLKEKGTDYWTTQSAGTDNSSGFSARGGGYRIGNTGVFANLKSNGYFWASGVDSNQNPILYYLTDNSNGLFYFVTSSKSTGLSVRLIRITPAEQ